jgi:flagellin-like hook-associated protein FlgL
MTVSNVSTLASQNVKNYSNDSNTLNTRKEKESATVELSETAQKYLNNKHDIFENPIAQNVDYKQESMNFSKASVNSYAGSFMASQANIGSSQVANLIS